MSFRTARSLLHDLPPLEEVRGSEEDLPADDAEGQGGSSMLGRIALQLRTDEELAARLQAGEAEALTILFQRHSALVFRIARRILRDDVEAEDAVQQVFLDFYRSVGKFDPAKGTFKVWLLMYAYHRTLNHKRRLQSDRFYEMESLEDTLLHEIGQGAPRSFPFLPTEAAYLVEEALGMIQPRQRQVIELVYYEGCTAEETAARTGESVRVVRHNLYRGLEKVRSILGDALRGRSKGRKKAPRKIQR